MRNIVATLTALLIAVSAIAQQAAPPPTLHAMLMQTDPAPTKTLLIFNTPHQAKAWTTAAGFALITAGGYLSGKAEMKSRYYGTTQNWDSYHVTRDAGLIVTGLGCGAIGASISIGQKPTWQEIAWKIATGAILYRITAEATYHWTAPAR